MSEHCLCIKMFFYAKQLEFVGQNTSKNASSFRHIVWNVMLSVNLCKCYLQGKWLHHFRHPEIMYITVHASNADIRFCDGPGLLISKINKKFTTPVKTRLLTVAYGTAFYAIKCE